MSTSVIQPSTATEPEFSIAQARSLVKDLFEAKAAVYWADFLVSISVGAAGFAAIENRHLPGRLVDLLSQGLGWQTPAGRWTIIAVLFVVHCLAFYRAALFTHELVHLRDDAVRGFRVVWNLLCGIPFLMPSFLYHTHVHHHVRR